MVFLWKYAAGGELISRPAVSAAGIYLYSEDRQIHALTPQGAVRWKFRLSGRPADSLSIGADGTVYACTDDGKLYAVNSAGRLIWQVDTDGAPAGEPAAAIDGTVYLAHKSGRLCAVSHLGFERWSIDTGNAILQPPVVDAGEAVYTFDDTGAISCRTQWGELRWTMPAAGQSDDNVNKLKAVRHAAVNRHVLYTSLGRNLQALTPEGEVLWSDEMRDDISALIVLPEEKGLFVLYSDGLTEALDFTGELLWSGQGAGYSSYPAAGDNSIYIMRGSKITIMDFTGKILYDTEPSGITLTQPVLGNNLLVCGSEEWVACAFTAESSLGDGWTQKGGGAAHDGTSGVRKWHFNETLFLSDMDYLYLRETIQSGDINDKIRALEEISDRIAAEGADRGENYLLHLVHLALSESLLTMESGIFPAADDYPSVRKKAADILGKYGNFESIELLTVVLGEEKYEDASASMILALGSLGSDFNGLPLEAIYNKVVIDDNGKGSERLALAAVSAVGKITDYSGAAVSGYGYRTLLEIFRGNYSAGTRRKAGEVLRSMK